MSEDKGKWHAELSTRARNTLLGERDGAFDDPNLTAQQAARIVAERGEQKLKGIYNCGRKTRFEIIAWVARHTGIEIGKKVEDPGAKPCPFCGGAKLGTSDRFDAPGIHWTVDCLNLTCEAIGPRGEDEAAAIKAWNRARRR